MTLDELQDLRKDLESQRLNLIQEAARQIGLIDGKLHMINEWLKTMQPDPVPNGEVTE